MEEQTDKQLVQSQFGPNAAKYATSRVHARGASLERLVELIQPRPAWVALDIATAAGHTAFVFAPHVAQVTATDITPEMLDVAAKLAAEKGIDNVDFEPADAEKLPFADASFDLVTCRIAPHHFPHIDRFVAESFRVLKPGGVFAVVDNVVPDDEAGEFVNRFEKLRDPSHGRCLSQAEWIDQFQAAGFETVYSETAPKRMTFEPWAVRLDATSETVETLRTMLREGPQDGLDFLQPRGEGEELTFQLSEAIIIGRKPGGEYGTVGAPRVRFLNFGRIA